MIRAMHSALAGLDVGARRVSNAAQNIVDMGSSGHRVPHDGYAPSRIGQTGVAGLPHARSVAHGDPSLPVYAPGDPDADAAGLAGWPDVDLASEIVDMKAARRSYEASLAVLDAVGEMQRALLDREA